MVNVKKIKFYVFVTLAAASLAFFLLAVKLGYNSTRYLAAFEGYNVPQLLYIGWIILAVATTLPISAVLFAGILYFSFIWAMIYAFIGILLGAVITFYLARWLGEDYVRDEYKSKDKGKMHALNVLIQKNSKAYVILLAFIYIFPTNLAYMIAGVTNMTLGQVVLITVLGNITTVLGVGMIFIGILNFNLIYIIGGAVILLLVNMLPILWYYKELKKLIVLLRK